jgi:ribosomal protein L34E
MCRYGFKTYKQHYACFDCRKAFKAPLGEIDGVVVTPRGAFVRQKFKKQANPQPTCPECKQPMHNMGLDFKAPKKTDLEQWQKVRRLYAAGFTFASCGCGGPGERPRRLRELPEFLRRQQTRSLGEKLLEQWKKP